MKRLVVPVILALSLLISTGAEAVIRCNTWTTVSTTAKTYSPCNRTTIGPWTSPLGGCLRYVSWRRTQHRVNAGQHNIRYQRTLLENEVQAVWKVQMGPVSVTKTQTMPGSHTTKVIASTYVTGFFPCGLQTSVLRQPELVSQS